MLGVGVSFVFSLMCCQWNSLFYTDLSYVNRIWCIAEFAVRVSGRGQDRFKDSSSFFTDLWHMHGPSDFVAHHGGSGIVRNLKLETVEQLKSDYVLRSLEGCFVQLVGARTPTVPMGKLIASMLCFEGMMSIVVDAAAAQARDIPVVIGTLYSDLCERMFGSSSGSGSSSSGGSNASVDASPAPIPAAIQGVLDWCMRCGVGASVITDPMREATEWAELQRAFYRLVDPAQGVLKAYLVFLGPHIKQGANSLLLLERLLATLQINGRGFVYDAAVDATRPSAPSPSMRPEGGCPPGFEFAPTATWYLRDHLGLDVRDFFCDGDSGSNMDYLADWGPNLPAGEDRRFNPGNARAWRAPKSTFPGWPESQWLFSCEKLVHGVIDPLAHFQSLSPSAAAKCVYRPAYVIAGRQSDVGSSGRIGWFETEKVYIQLTGEIKAATLDEVKSWMERLDAETHPKAIRVFGSRQITARPKKLRWNPNLDGQDTQMH